MRLVKILLWAAFGLMLVTGGFVLLAACDIDHPHFLSTAQRFCPVPVDTSQHDRAMAKRDALEGRIHDAELKIAQVTNCAPTPSPGPVQQRPQPSPLPSPSPRAQNNDPGPTVGRRGKLEITLWWNTTDDLDLTVVCPGGKLSSRAGQQGPACGGGIRDVDANQKMVNPVTDPKEHATWDSPPDGQYRVEVNAYQTSHPDPIEYSVRIQLDDDVRICRGKVQWDGRSGNGYYQSPITFRPEHPLADCHSEDVPQHLCSGAGCK